MTQAIAIKWLTQTETKPYRWKVKAFAGELTMPQDAWFNEKQETRKAAMADGAFGPKSYALWTFLLHKGWDGCWVISQDHKGTTWLCSMLQAVKSSGSTVESA